MPMLMDVTIFLLLLLFIVHRPPALQPVAYAQLLPIINEGGGIDPTKTPIYIVHVEKPPCAVGALHRSLRSRELKSWYTSFLPNATLSSGERRLVYSYREVMSGFAARLTTDEVEAMQDTPGFISAYQEREHPAYTTYTPTYLDLKKGQSYGPLWQNSSMGAGQIIGVIDTGISRNHPSFSDDGMPLPPKRWRGTCYWGGTRTCNKKLLGAIGFRNGSRVDPTDNDGHGTHVASIAAGNFVVNAKVNGQASGTASGIAPRAHLAVYKVIFIDPTGLIVSTDSDRLAGIDQAIRDNVDILQMSLGDVNVSLHQCAVCTGSFAAITKGIFPCAAAGNQGPTKSDLANDAPWILTVGASTTDRKIMSVVRLGNGIELLGESAYQPGNFPSAELPLAFPYAQLRTKDSMTCHAAELNKLNLTGNIVMCYNSYHIGGDIIGRHVKRAGGAAMVLLNDLSYGETTIAYVHKLPAANINNTGTRIMEDYYKKSSNPTAAIKFGGTQFGIYPSPGVASFSSRGPSLNNGGIIKPDVIAPGVNILAAWPSQFHFLSGTSMATPHVSGVAALLKNKYPKWSPAAIKSAIMTTAYTLDFKGNPIIDEHEGSSATVFERGAGHVDPEAASNPGLIYELNASDYERYLCGYYQSNKEVQEIIGRTIQCSQVWWISPEHLNYPSFSVNLGGRTPSVRVSRSVTNVGNVSSVYNVRVDKEPDGVRVVVNPATLQFSMSGGVLKYTVTFSLKGGSHVPAAGEVKDGSLSWYSGKYIVSSPIAVTFV